MCIVLMLIIGEFNLKGTSVLPQAVEVQVRGWGRGEEKHRAPLVSMHLHAFACIRVKYFV